MTHDTNILTCVQHVTTTEVHFYLAFKLKGKEDMVVAYKALLPRLHLIQPVYRKLLHDLQPHLETGVNSQHAD